MPCKFKTLKKKMKRLFIIALAAMGIASCAPKDVPMVEFSQERYTVSRDGGELIIPVSSTGVDNVTISYPNGDIWEIDPTNGDMTPVEGWIKVVKVINNYETRALASWTSGICLEIAPNDTDQVRSADVTVRSFQKSEKVVVEQGF